MAEKKQNTTFSMLALALANDYESIFVIDSTDDSYIEYTAEGGDKTLSVRSQGEDFYADTVINCKKLVWPEDQARFLKAFQKKNIVDSLKSGESFSINYRLVISGKPQYYFLKTIPMNDTDIVIGVRNVDKQTRRELKDREKRNIYSEIADSLAGMFEAIYHINFKTGNYTEFYTTQSYSDLGIDSGGEKFFEKVKNDIQIHIYEEDREMLVRELDRDNLLSKLENEKMYSLVYRQYYDGRMQYLNLIAFKQESDDDHIVIGIRNIDEQKRQEENVETYSHIAGALASRYEVIYYIDVDTNEYIQYSASDQYAKLGTTKKGNDFFKDAYSDINKYIHRDDKDRVLMVINKEHLLEILAHEGSLTMSYRQMLDGLSQYVAMMVVRPKNDERHLVMGVTNIDAQKKREEIIRAENQTFSEISMALAQRYEVIYHVNVLTNEYIEYSSSEKYAKLDIGARGSDFFGETQKNMKRDIYPDDYPMMSVAMKKEYLMKSLKETGKFLITYRLMLDGRPQYVTLFAVRPKEDSHHIIIAVANIDSTRRMEIEFEDALGNAMDMANHDPLTGLKNKRSYAQTEMKLDGIIEEKGVLNFSILVCDINGLKLINDTKGHQAGDQFIQDACTTICDVFKNSTVFRIGGDEVAVILEGEDYKNRDELVEKLGEIQKENKEKNLATVAFGISDFRPKLDNRVQDVFERADQAMYLDKKNYQETDRNVVENALMIQKYKHERVFFDLFMQLLNAMTDSQKRDVQLIENILVKICSHLRLSKAITYVYLNPQEEAEGKGETLCCYDLGIEGEEIHRLRVVSGFNSIATMITYMSPNEKPHTKEEREQMILVMKTTIMFISRNRLGEMVERLIFYDTDGYKNFRSFQKYIMQNRENLGRRVAFRYNLRHFSLVNQDLGKDMGDKLMRQHFSQLEGMIGDSGIICRLGGDNFIGICGNEVLGQVLSYLTEAKLVYDESEDKSVNLSTSTGVFRIPADLIINNPGEIMGPITQSFHVAQNGGKDRILFYQGGVDKDREAAKKVQQLFPEALRNEEFRVYYQPKVDIRTGEIIGAEALCRWFHDDKMISPGEFIPVLEETSDICKLDFYMLDHVCSDIRKWLDQGKKVVRISVNLSRKHMINVNLLDNLLKIVDRHSVPHSCLEIELTETTTDVEFNDLKRVVTGLQRVGIFSSVDDFGVGYSSLNLIKELPWNVIKVDKSFLDVKGDESDKVSRIMFKHVISMTSEMGIECIVEGVETQEQLEILRENNCIYAQGFLFDRPIPHIEFEERLSRGYYEIP